MIFFLNFLIFLNILYHLCSGLLVYHHSNSGPFTLDTYYALYMEFKPYLLFGFSGWIQWKKQITLLLCSVVLRFDQVLIGLINDLHMHGMCAEWVIGELL